MKNEYFECSCYSPEHTFRISYFPDDTDELYLSVQLVKQPFWQRVIKSIKYIFGHQSIYGHWDETIISKEEAIRLKDFLGDFVDGRTNKET